MVKKLARLRTGVYLYARRGLREGSDVAGQMRGWLDLSDRMLADLVAGRLSLPGVARKKTMGYPVTVRLFTRDTLGF